ncbi:hypothetical protein EC957_006309 [Mortierella hygrophila]|uniref:Uncharacterized protein n=1 Tax=Mortierella hygrophila TaxID=979708 RepID=A0A9P6FEM6_9FUNG|nr:hypothetical protein EC957_006309 [Mortierella hygrophila]
MNAICAPTHYFHVTACFDDNNKNIFGSTESIMSLSRNAHHVRQLALGRYDIIYYVSCVIAFLDQLDTLQQNTTTTATIGHSPALSRPTWLAPLDPKIYTVFPIPPMTMLTKLDLRLFATSQGGGYEKNSMAALTQACWIISFNLNLLDLKLTSVILKDRRAARLLMTTLLRLQRLQALYLGFILRSFTTHKVELYFLSACPPTLRKLTLKSHEGPEEDNYMIEDFSKDYVEYEPGTLLSWEKLEEECGLTTMPRRQGPFLGLRELHFSEVAQSLSRDDLQSILQQCPNLITLKMPRLSHISDVQKLAGEIVQWCPRLSDLSIRCGWEDDKVRELKDWILRALPPQQITRFMSNGAPVPAIQGLDDAESMFQRHSSTLREISLHGYKRIDSKVVQTILVECEALESFKIYISSYDDPHPLCLRLEDAIEIPWACTRIQELQLAIAIPDRPLIVPVAGTWPYYIRPPPTTLSVEETQQFKDLESLYRQLGKLTQLRRLDLRAYYYDPTGKSNPSGAPFPGMLNLGSEKTGQPGYLQLLGGLTKLKTLVGSVAAYTRETMLTIGMDEVEMSDDDDGGDNGDGDEKKGELTGVEDLSEAEHLSMLAHCPNLNTIVVPPRTFDPAPLKNLHEEIVQQLYSMLTNVEGFFCGQQCELGTVVSDPGLTNDDVGSLFQRHSGFLREIVPGRIQDLNLTIAIPDEPLHRSGEMGIVLYYNPPSLLILSAAETTQFRSLEALYRQLGALTELECVELRAAFYDLVGTRSASAVFKLNSFPWMLNLRNEETGQLGYLDKLRGLTEVKTLYGSVSVTTKDKGDDWDG